MTTATFDTLGYFERLKAAGFSEAQAKAQADGIRELVDVRLVTKEHLDIRMAELRNDLAAVKNEMLRWMVGGFIAQSALIIAVLSLMRAPWSFPYVGL